MNSTANRKEHLAQLVVFDLDDTLYPELEYVRSGFRHIARLTAHTAGVPDQVVFAFLWTAARQRAGRGDNFDRLLEAHPAIKSKWNVAQLVRSYRCHTPEIAFYSGVKEMLEQLRTGKIRLGVITDGPPESQRKKLEVLRLSEIVEEAIITDQFGIECRKPSTFAYLRMAHRCGVEPRSCLYIGDNPGKDFAAPRSMGWETVRLRLSGQLHERAEARSPEFSPDIEVTSIPDLKVYLQARLGRPKAPLAN